MMNKKSFVRTVAGLALLVLAGCATTPAPEGSLYDRLGGKPAITAVVDDFVANVTADPRINSFFAEVNIARLKLMLADQICQASGGPCVYTGRTMRESHPASLGIKSEHFDAMVEDLVKTLNKFKVPAKEQGDLLALLGPMKPDIVRS